MNIKQAVFQSGGRRFRPVLLTSLTTFAGLMPLLFEKSTQAQFLIPMAISLCFGIFWHLNYFFFSAFKLSDPRRYKGIFQALYSGYEVINALQI